MLTALNFNKKLPRDWKVNVKIETRHELKSGVFGIPSSTKYDLLLADFAFVAARKVDINQSLAMGYLMRIKEGSLVNRLIQQWILTNKFDGYRMSHRLSADQTFENGQDTEFRFRYRISALIPTNGQSIDPGEFFLKFNNEYLNSLEGGDYDLEIRLVPHLGYKLSETNKLELGIDYRLDTFLEGQSRHRFWTAINWYLAI